MICSMFDSRLRSAMYAAVFAFGPHCSEMDMKNIEVLGNLGIASWQYLKRVVKIRTENCSVTLPGGPGSNFSDDESQISKGVASFIGGPTTINCHSLTADEAVLPTTSS